MPLIGLFFPGTYSGLNYNMGSTPLPRQTVSHFLLTQDSDVWGELIRGVRYLDVDLRYCPNQEKSSSTSETPKDGRQRRGTPADGPAAAAGSDDGIQWTVSCIDGAQSVAKISGVPGLGGYLGGGYGGGGRRSASTGGGALVRSPAGRGSADTPAAAALPRAWRSVSGGDDTRHRCSVSDKKNDLLFVLKDVKEFLKTAKYEIVILDFHHFPEGFEGQTNLHHEFVSLLYSELGDYILPFNNITYNSTLKEVWHAGHNIIVAYNDSETTKEFAWLWGPIPRLYGDHQTTEGLKTFFQQCMDDASATSGATLEISMTRNGTTPAVSTQNTSDILHGLADMDDRNITKWFHDYWWRHSNIVATDFFLGNHMTDVNVRACLDKANNVIFQVISED